MMASQLVRDAHNSHLVTNIFLMSIEELKSRISPSNSVEG